MALMYGIPSVLRRGRHSPQYLPNGSEIGSLNCPRVCLLSLITLTVINKFVIIMGKCAINDAKSPCLVV